MIIKTRIHNLISKVMAIANRPIPTLKGDAAKRFIDKADKASKKRETVDYSKQVNTMRAILKKSNMY